MRAQIQSLVKEQRSHKLRGTAEKRKKRIPEIILDKWKNVLTWMPRLHKEGRSVSIMNGGVSIGNNKRNKKTTHRLGENICK